MRRLNLHIILSICATISIVATVDLLARSGPNAADRLDRPAPGLSQPGLVQSRLAQPGLAKARLAQTRSAQTRLAQSAVGYHCQTEAGICPIDPAPLGAPCRCGTYQGFAVP